MTIGENKYWGNSMLALLGFSMIAVFMFLIITKRMSAMVALVSIPILFALLGGFGPGIGEMMLNGIKQVAPTGVMLMFAILYFGVMIDAGLFDPLVSKILAFVKGDPLKIVLGTAILSMLVALDGDGTTTYMITVSAMLPLYKRIGMNPLILTCVAMLSFGVMNMTPWGGPTARASSRTSVGCSRCVYTAYPCYGGRSFMELIYGVYSWEKRAQKIGSCQDSIFKGRGACFK